MLDELARRFGDGNAPVAVTLRGLTETERQAIADLLGRDRMPGPESRVRLARLVEALGLGATDDLRAEVEALRGPIPDRRAARLAARRAHDELWDWLEGQVATLALGGDPARFEAWVARLRAFGARGGPERHRRRLEEALRVLRALPADGIPLAALADDVLCDPHALDLGRSLSSIVLDAVAIALERDQASDAEGTRLLWETVGVAPDPLSSTVLALALPASAPPPLGPWLGQATASREPVILTLAQLRRWPVAPLAPTGCAYVVENPSLVAEAAARAWAGPPLVCSSGRPTVAVVTLLRQLATAGATLHQHADFDPAGLAITAWLAERAGTTPWRMTSRDYLAAVARPRTRQTLTGRVPESPWEPQLETVVRETGVAVYEEELRGELLGCML